MGFGSRDYRNSANNTNGDPKDKDDCRSISSCFGCMNEIEKHLAKSIHPVGKSEGEEQDVINLNTDIAPAPDDVFCINVMHASDHILPKDVDPN